MAVAYLLGQEFLPVMKGSHGDRSKRAIGNKDQRIYFVGSEILLKGPDQPVIELLCVRQKLFRGPFFDFVTKLPNLLGQPVHRDLYGVSPEGVRETDQEFQSVFKENRVHDQRRLRKKVQLSFHITGCIHTVIFEVVPQLKDLDEFNGLSCFREVDLRVFRG